MRTHLLSLIYLLFRSCRCIILEYWPSVFKTFWLGNELENNLVNLRNYVVNQLICILWILGKLCWIEPFSSTDCRMISLTLYTVYFVHSLQLYKPLFHFRYKFKPNTIQVRGLRSSYYSSYLYASKHIILQNFWPSMDTLHNTKHI